MKVTNEITPMKIAILNYIESTLRLLKRLELFLDI